LAPIDLVNRTVAHKRTSPTAGSGAFAGIESIAAYAALEILLTGPFTLQKGESVGASFGGVVYLYFALYLVLGAAIGALAGLFLRWRGKQSHHLSPFLSALLMTVFVGNAWCWGFSAGVSLYLAALPPIALWLYCGLLFPEEDRARTLAGSPWGAALLMLAPNVIVFDLMAGWSIWLSNVAAAGLVVVVLGTSLLARRLEPLAMIAQRRPQALVTLAVLIANFVMLPVVSAPLAVRAEQPAVSERPNIVLITLDTTRADHLSLYGYPRRTTPQLEAFASGATIYRHAYANGDMTLASHGALFTGLFPTENGAHYNGDSLGTIAEEIPTIAELLRDAGYRTYASVANTALLDPRYGFSRGFDRYVMPRRLAVVSPTSAYLLRMGLYKLTLPWLWTEAMRRFVDGGEIAAEAEIQASEAGGDPFFLFVNFMESHRPWISSNEFRAQFPHYDQTFDEMKVRSFSFDVLAGTHTVSPDEFSKMHAAYDGCIAYLDSLVGQLLKTFQQRPWYDKSVIIITADHGELFGENGLIDHGNSVNQGLTSIPMAVKFSGQKAGHEVQSPVSQVDLYSTIAAAAGVALPGPRRGVDLAAGEPGVDRDIIMESYPLANFTKQNPSFDRLERALVRGRWKVVTSTRGRRELYDMATDPRETQNLWSSQPDIAQELENQLHQWAAEMESRRPKNKQIPRESDFQRLRALGYLQ
jgi:arylsulfatase A-like enzyme